MSSWRARTALLSTFRRSIGGLARDAVDIDADDHLLAGVDAGLRARRGFLNAQFGNAGGNRIGHAAHRLDLGDVYSRRAR